MTLKVLTTKQFEKDLKKQKRRGKQFLNFSTVVRLIENNETLPLKYRNHKLSGNY